MKILQIIIQITPKTMPSYTIDAENGMWICACGKEAEETGYCEECTPLSIIKREIADDDTPLAVLAKTVVCHHCDKRTPKGDEFPECEECGMYLDLVRIKGKMVSRYTKTGMDRVARHEKE